MALNQNFCQRMSRASFPNITNESNSVRFAVNGLENQNAFRQASRALRLTGLPDSLKTLEDRFLEEDLSIANTTAFGMERTTFTITGKQYRGNKNRDRGRGRGSGQGDPLRKQIKDEIRTTVQQEFETERLQAKNGH